MDKQQMFFPHNNTTNNHYLYHIRQNENHGHVDIQKYGTTCLPVCIQKFIRTLRKSYIIIIFIHHLSVA